MLDYISLHKKCGEFKFQFDYDFSYQTLTDIWN